MNNNAALAARLSYRRILGNGAGIEEAPEASEGFAERVIADSKVLQVKSNGTHWRL